MKKILLLFFLLLVTVPLSQSPSYRSSMPCKFDSVVLRDHGTGTVSSTAIGAVGFYQLPNWRAYEPSTRQNLRCYQRRHPLCGHHHQDTARIIATGANSKTPSLDLRERKDQGTICPPITPPKNPQSSHSDF